MTRTRTFVVKKLITTQKSFEAHCDFYARATIYGPAPVKQDQNFLLDFFKFEKNLESSYQQVDIYLIACKMKPQKIHKILKY